MSDAAQIEAKLREFGWTEVVRNPRLGPCWEWNGGRCEARGGYGQVRYDGAPRKVHRLSYKAFVGDLPDDVLVLHACDNPPCMNPAHLTAGTHAENMADMVAKGRGVNPVYRSQDAPTAKLSPSDVDMVRVLLSQGESLSEIGRRFGVTKQAIWRIKKGQTWTPAKMTR